MNKKTTIIALALAMTCSAMFYSCGGKDKKSSDDAEEEVESEEQATSVSTKELKINEGKFHHNYLVADQTDESHIYKNKADKSKTFIVISKKEYRLYVYEAGNDTSLVASFPCCYAINAEAKKAEGDNCTPECSMSNPFTISQLQDASTWCFDFQDGRGPIKAFGNWFLRLDLTKSFPDNPTLAKNRSVGIHGSTGNERSIPGRDSHGCIRLYDNDLNTLHDTFVQVGTKVIIKGINEDKLPFEQAAQKALGDKYVAPTKGYTDKFSGKAQSNASSPAGAPDASQTSTPAASQSANPATSEAANDAAVKAATKANRPTGATSAAGGAPRPVKK